MYTCTPSNHYFMCQLFSQYIPEFTKHYLVIKLLLMHVCPSGLSSLIDPCYIFCLCILGAIIIVPLPANSDKQLLMILSVHLKRCNDIKHFIPQRPMIMMEYQQKYSK